MADTNLFQIFNLVKSIIPLRMFANFLAHAAVWSDRSTAIRVINRWTPQEAQALNLRRCKVGPHGGQIAYYEEDGIEKMDGEEYTRLRCPICDHVERKKSLKPRKPNLGWIASFLIGVTTLAHSDVKAQVNGNDLRSYCNDAISMTKEVPWDVALRGTACKSFVAGFIGGWVQGLAVKRGLAPSLCLPPEATYDQFIRVYLRWTEMHPERLHLEPSRAIHEALSQAFPCG